MIIDTTEVQAINSFSRLESLKEVYGIIWVLIPIFTPILGIKIGVLVIVWLEREIFAGIQQRIGPEYAGRLGILQALAAGTKLLFKENLLPSRGDTRLFSIGPSIAVISILLSYLVIPFGYHLVIADLSIGVFLWNAISSIAPVGLLISSTVDIVEAQSKYGFWGWNLWRPPIGFLVFLISSLAECERLPFDLPEAEEELVAVRIFTDMSISPSLSPRQRPDRYAFCAGRNLPDKEFRYLRTVIVTAAVHRGFGRQLPCHQVTNFLDLLALGRR
ncbi:hypothetical protein E3N88_22965 [Mikania micrantha]|uniref:Uncharacterized protein n=1 Tax=Mikania micrantha TaxID=192012 RepID=A0A5N6NC62_9ASTR|nr:hypothetical protein E3N88_22965 [Mikania micrantha]